MLHVTGMILRCNTVVQLRPCYFHNDGPRPRSKIHCVKVIIKTIQLRYSQYISFYIMEQVHWKFYDLFIFPKNVSLRNT